MLSQGFLSLPEQLTQKARAALDLGRPEEAVPLLLQALTVAGSGSEKAVVMERLSCAFGQTGDTEAALLWADRTIAASPDWCWAHLRRADALDNVKRVDEAINAASVALRLEPELPSISRTLVRLYLNDRDTMKAGINAKRFQELAPDDADAYYYLAEVALIKAQKERSKTRREALLDRAERDLRIGLALEPASPYLQRLMGSLRQQQDRYEEALPHYFEAVRSLPTSPHDQWQARKGLNRFLFNFLILLAFAGWPVQGAGVLLGWKAWVAFGIAVIFVLLSDVFVGLFPKPVLRANKAFQSQPAPTQAALFQLASDRKKVWHFTDGITGFGIFTAAAFNLPPLLLRGLWNAGVLAFQFWKHG